MSRRDDLKKYQAFFDGDRTTIYQNFVSWRINTTDITDEDDYLSIRDFWYRNDIRVIQNERVAFMPTEFEIASDKNEEDVGEWLGSRNFSGKTFWEALPGYYLTHENMGTLFLKLWLKDSVSQVTKLYSENVSILFAPDDVNEIIEYVFKWEEERDLEDTGTQTIQMEERIDRVSYRTFANGQQIDEVKHNFGFIPVVKIIREQEDGSPYGRSGIKDLLDPQQDVNVILTKRAWATKFNSFQGFCPRNPDQVAPGTNIKITPGFMSPIPLDTVGGNLNLAPLEAELDDALTHLYTLGSITPPHKDESINTNLSGVAIDKQLEPLRRYTLMKLPYLRMGFEELIEKAFRIMEKEVDVSIDFPNLEYEDAEEKTNKINTLYQMGYEEEVLRLFGYDQNYIDKMKEDKEIQDAANLEKQQAMFEKETTRYMQGDEDESGDQEE